MKQKNFWGGIFGSLLIALCLSACGTSSTSTEFAENPMQNIQDQRQGEEISAENEQESSIKDKSQVNYLLSTISYYDDDLSFLYEDSYTYDDRGNILTYSHDRGWTDSYEYDEKDRLSTVTYYAGGQVSYREEYEYNEIGLMTKCTIYDKDVHDTVIAEFQYDQSNNMISKTYTKLSPYITGRFYDCTFVYDGDTLVSMTEKKENQTVQHIEFNYAKNQENRTSYRPDGTIEYYNEWYIVQPWDICLNQKAYAPNGNMQSERTSELQYDAQGKLLEAIVYDDGELVGSIELEYDDNENIVRQTHYDEMGFVTTEMRYEYVTSSAS